MPSLWSLIVQASSCHLIQLSFLCWLLIDTVVLVLLLLLFLVFLFTSFLQPFDNPVNLIRHVVTSPCLTGQAVSTLRNWLLNFFITNSPWFSFESGVIFLFVLLLRCIRFVMVKERTNVFDDLLIDTYLVVYLLLREDCSLSYYSRVDEMKLIREGVFLLSNI